MNRTLGKATTAAILLLISTGSARAQELTNSAAAVLKPHIMLTPDKDLLFPVHQIMITTNGIFLLENLDLDALSSSCH